MVLVLDIGGSYLKAGVYDSSRKQFLQIERAPMEPFVDLENVYREINPNGLLSRVCDLLNKLNLDFVLEKSVPLFISTQMHGTALVNKGGSAVRNLISWQDARSMDDSGEVGSRSRLTDSEIMDLGNEFRVGLPIATLAQIASEELSSLDGLTYMDIGGYVASALARSAPEDYKIHQSNAAATGFFSFSEMNWGFPVIEKLGLSGVRFPDIIQGKEVIGEFKLGEKLINVYSPFGDQQLALFGAGLDSSSISLNIATGSQVSILSDNSKFGNYQLRPFFGNQFLRTITHIPAGRALNCFVRMFSDLTGGDDQKVWSLIEERVAVMDGVPSIDANVSVFKSNFGESGSLLGLSESNLNIENIFYGLFDNMAENYFKSYKRLVDGTDDLEKTLLFSGGLVNKSKSLQKAIINKFGRAGARFSPHDEDVLMGLIKVAESKI